MNIRRATAEDYEVVLRLLNGLVNEDRYSNHDRDSYARLLEMPDDHAMFVADDGDKVIGVASVSIRYVVRYAQPIAELDEMFVDPHDRSHGVGRQLMDAVEQFARDQACYRLYIESAWPHEDGQQFYEHVGYTKSGYQFMKTL